MVDLVAPTMPLRDTALRQAKPGEKPIKLSPENVALLANLYPTFALLREQDPVHWSELGFWVASRYEDVRGIVMNRTDWAGRLCSKYPALLW